MTVVIGPKGATHMLAHSSWKEKLKADFSVFLSLGVTTSLFFHWIYCHSCDVFSFSKLRFVDLMLITVQISFLSVCPSSHQCEGCSDGAPGACSSQVGSETGETVNVAGFHTLMLLLLRNHRSCVLEREACGSGADKLLCLPEICSRMCVCAGSEASARWLSQWLSRVHEDLQTRGRSVTSSFPVWF